MTLIRHVNASAAIIHHDGRVLLVLKTGWDKFSLPITKIDDGGDQAAAETGGAAASRVIEEELGVTTSVEPGLLLDIELLQISGRTGDTGHYQVQVYGYSSESDSVPEATVARWLSPTEILDPKNEEIAPTARTVIAKLSEAALDGGREFPPVAADSPRTSTASPAIIQRNGAQGSEWLAQFNEGWGRYFLVGGHEKAGETAVECLIREVQEELKLTVNEKRLTPLEFEPYDAWSTSAWRDTHYDVSAFALTLGDDEIEDVRKAENRWLTADEINCERCTDGKLISPTMRAVLTAMGML